MARVPSDLSDSIRLAREAIGVSQRALGEQAGIPQASISKFESGMVDPRLSTLVALARTSAWRSCSFRAVPPAVQSLARTREGRTRSAASSARVRTQVEVLRQDLAGMSASGPGAEDVARLAQALWALGQLAVSDAELRTAVAAHRAATALHRSRKADKTARLSALRVSVDAIVALRDEKLGAAGGGTREEGVRPAYNLDDEDGDG
ncbi:MAG: helix-turn-helix transcriptional regulator [Betaproteobacteria bacterium]|nr:helix-turn-helix transcriptional regulator [Betaproteobacteria bacterium]